MPSKAREKIDELAGRYRAKVVANPQLGEITLEKTPLLNDLGGEFKPIDETEVKPRRLRDA